MSRFHLAIGEGACATEGECNPPQLVRTLVEGGGEIFEIIVCIG